MDVWLDMADQCQRRADTRARDVGFERVRVNDIARGDQLIHRSERFTVVSVDHRTDEVSSLYWVTLWGKDGDLSVRCYDDGERVCRSLPEEPF
jgi:hypothetical protein